MKELRIIKEIGLDVPVTDTDAIEKAMKAFNDKKYFESLSYEENRYVKSDKRRMAQYVMSYYIYENFPIHYSKANDYYRAKFDRTLERPYATLITNLSNAIEIMEIIY